LLRNLTERNECVSGGNTKIIGTDRNRVKKEISKALEDRACLENMKKKSLAFGSGNASEKIVKNLLSLL
jgi:UDP-N-acetylglucosamine 2-epimerase